MYTLTSTEPYVHEKNGKKYRMPSAAFRRHPDITHPSFSRVRGTPHDAPRDPALSHLPSLYPPGPTFTDTPGMITPRCSNAVIARKAVIASPPKAGVAIPLKAPWTSLRDCFPPEAGRRRPRLRPQPVLAQGVMRSSVRPCPAIRRGCLRQPPHPAIIVLEPQVWPVAGRQTPGAEEDTTTGGIEEG